MGCTPSKTHHPPPGHVSANRITEGLKAALDLAVRETVRTLGRPGGFEGCMQANADGTPIRREIDFPEEGGLRDVLCRVRTLSEKFKLQVDDLKHKMNTAAERACASSLDVLIDAVRDLVFRDADAILRGDNHAAADYMKEAVGRKITERFEPIVRREMDAQGANALLATLLKAYSTIPLVAQPPPTDLCDHVVACAFRALFDELGRNEARIRHNPSMQAQNPAIRQCFKTHRAEAPAYEAAHTTTG
jgi:hypothetical protein